MTSWRHKLWTWWLGCALCACATTHGTAPAEHPQNEAFARIQVHEAELHSARRTATNSGADCAARCDAVSQGCRASESLCRIAHDLSDADALTRCERGRGVCEAMSLSAADCRCPADPGP